MELVAETSDYAQLADTHLHTHFACCVHTTSTRPRVKEAVYIQHYCRLPSHSPSMIHEGSARIPSDTSVRDRDFLLLSPITVLVGGSSQYAEPSDLAMP